MRREHGAILCARAAYRPAAGGRSSSPLCGDLALGSCPARDMSLTRSFGVALVAALFALGSLAALVSGVSLLMPGGPLEPIWLLNPRAHSGFVALHSWAPILLALLTLLCGAAAIGLISGKRWGYRLGIALLLINFTGDLLNGALHIEPRALFGLPVVALLLWYLSSQHVRAYFARAVTPHNPRLERP